jgi:hypothetical protein
MENLVVVIMHVLLECCLPKHLQQAAINEKIYDCGYLLPKDLFVEKTLAASNHSSPNYALVNCIGGPPGPEPCRYAVETADYAAFRDDRSNLVPDCAIMTKELFQGHINEVADVVLN